MATKTKKKINLKELSNKIISGDYPVTNIDLEQFFYKTSDGTYQPDPDKRIQVRGQTRDIKFIEKTINKIESTGDCSKLNNLTCIEMPDGELLILNGSHTSEIQIKIGHTHAKAHILSYEDDLGGKMSSAQRLGNLLNVDFFERRGVANEDIKNEINQLIHEKKERGETPTLSDDEKADFLDAYPQLGPRSLGQMLSYFEGGGRTNATIMHDDSSKEDFVKALKNDDTYSEYFICPVQSFSEYHDSFSAAFRGMAKENKSKALLTYHIKNEADRKKWSDPSKKRKNEVDAEFKQLSNYFEVTLEYKFMRYQ
tara:strand:+ start:116 stop:1048 length:933 start_codon:yes stop_codon:yes gene_type:complete